MREVQRQHAINSSHSMEALSDAFRPLTWENSQMRPTVLLLAAEGALSPSTRVWGTGGWQPPEDREALDWLTLVRFMGWDVEDDGLGVLFSRDIPTLVREEMRPAADAFLERCGLTVRDLAGYVCHPGGVKVLDALEQAFDLVPGTMVRAREILRDYGNMSAVTVLFVLQRMIGDGLAGRHLMSALGPGFSAGFQIIEG